MPADNNTTKLPPISAFSHDGEDHKKPLSFKTTLLTALSSQNSAPSQYLYPSNTSNENLPSISSPHYYSQSAVPNCNNSGMPGSSGAVPTVIRSPYLEPHQGSIASGSDVSSQTDFYNSHQSSPFLSTSTQSAQPHYLQPNSANSIITASRQSLPADTSYLPPLRPFDYDATSPNPPKRQKTTVSSPAGTTTTSDGGNSKLTLRITSPSPSQTSQDLPNKRSDSLTVPPRHRHSSSSPLLSPIVNSPNSSVTTSSSFELLPEISLLHNSRSSTNTAISPGNKITLTATSTNNTKRPFRQRRKDPSCDSCRERKVKCDATESSSCSECVSRQLKCQFTKETNRRMSSIKQIRDLEKSVYKLVGHINEYQGLLRDSHIQPPKHLIISENELISEGILSFNSDTNSQSPEQQQSTPGYLSPIPSPGHSYVYNAASPVQQSYPKSPSPGLLVPPRRNSEMALRDLSPSPCTPNSQQSQAFLKTLDFSVPNSRRQSVSMHMTHTGQNNGGVHNYSAVRSFYRLYNNDIVRTPVSHRLMGETTNEDISHSENVLHFKPTELPSNLFYVLPSRDVAHELVSIYRKIYEHWLCPFHDWDDFNRRLDRVYDEPENFTLNSWTSLILTTLALGVRQHAIPDITFEDADRYIKVGALVSPVRTLDTKPSLVSTYSGLMISIYLAETNRLEIATVWASAVCSMAYEQGLTQPRDSAQRKLWWTIFIWDRMLALRSGRKPFIPEDYKPSYMLRFAENERHLQVYANIIIHITHIIEVVNETMYTQTILSKPTLDTFNTHFEMFWSILPETFMSPDSATPLNAIELSILFLLKFTQHVLLRLNLTPLAMPQQTARTIEALYFGAKHIVRFLRRFKEHLKKTLQPKQDLHKVWQKELSIISFNVMTAHTWQCLLVLIANDDFDSAKDALSALEAQAVGQPIAKNYCLFLDGFVKLLLRKNETFPDYKPLEDQDVTSIMSTDLQAIDSHAWVWPDFVLPNEDLGIPSVIIDPGSPDPTPDSVLLSSNGTPPSYDDVKEKSEPAVMDKNWHDWAGLKARFKELKSVRAGVKVKQPSLTLLTPNYSSGSSGNSKNADGQDNAIINSVDSKQPKLQPPPITVTADDETVQNSLPSPSSSVLDPSSASRMSLSRII